MEVGATEKFLHVRLCGESARQLRKKLGLSGQNMSEGCLAKGDRAWPGRAVEWTRGGS